MTLQTYPVLKTIQKRYSCRTYRETPIDGEQQRQIRDYIAALPPGPFGSRPRLALIAASGRDGSALRGLGTYGFIRNPTGFIIGSSRDDQQHLVDFGYRMEAVILKATDLNLGTCWLGGTFNRSRFAREIDLEEEEIIPAVTSIGIPAPGKAPIDMLTRRSANADQRKPFGELFFDEAWGKPLTDPKAGRFSQVLEMVRIGPSASNKQPWRVIYQPGRFHVFLERTSGYPPPLFNSLLRLADMQSVDMGIALCHFEFSAIESGLKGSWKHTPPDLDVPEEGVEYILSWVID